MRSITLLAMVVAAGLATPASGDVSVEIRAHEEAFARACQAGDVPGVLSLYADDAQVVWPGQGEESHDKAGLEKLVHGFCKDTKGLKIAIKSLDAKSLGADYVAVTGHWQITSDGPDGKPNVGEMRATEVLERRAGRLVYVIDHASVGIPPAR